MSSSSQVRVLSCDAHSSANEYTTEVTIQGLPAALASATDASFDQFYFAGKLKAITQDILFELFRVLSPGGTLRIAQPLSEPREASTIDYLSKSMILSGFTSQFTADQTDFIFTATKPSYTVGAKQGLKLKASTTTTVWATPITSASQFIDEDSLLDQHDLTKPARIDDCEIGNDKKACKNCSCGRDEEEEIVRPKLTPEMLENPGTGGCGNCSLGDAFRCGGCPYFGLPAFVPGQKLVLPDDYMDDI